jgi:hypothetical protein
MTLVEELKWRGLLHDIMPGTEELLNKEKINNKQNGWLNKIKILNEPNVIRKGAIPTYCHNKFIL